MANANRSQEELLAKIESLRFRLEEAEETLRAIGSGDVDAFVVSGPEGEQVFTVKGAEQPYRVLVENMNEGAATLVADGTIFYCNKSLAAMLQLPIHKLIGKQLGSCVTSADYPLFLTLLEKCANEPTSGELAFLNEGGNSVLVLISCSSLELSGHRGISVVVTDITERKKTEEQLFQSQKMEVIGQLSGGIAHDLNNILTAIIGFSSLIDMHLSVGDPNKDYLSQVLVAADRATELTKSLLAFSRKQVINPKPVDLNQIISKTEKFMKRIISEDIDFNLAFRKEDLIVNADSGQIEQILMNLVTNARDAMPNGGLLSIETDAVVLDHNFIVAHGFGELGRYAVMTLSDSGVGMVPETCKKVFEPFFTTKEVGKGTGLGLSIAYGIVKQHNGFIDVHSEPGKGTTFRIYLPLIQAAVDNPQKGNTEVVQGGNETILVVDDDFAVRKLLENTLNEYGYTVITAIDGNDAVAKFTEKQTSINLVLLDVVMPRMDGKEVCDKIRKIDPAVKAIFMSGYTSDIIHKHGVLDESLQFIPKPLNPRQLLLKVRNVLDGNPNEKD